MRKQASFLLVLVSLGVMGAIQTPPLPTGHSMRVFPFGVNMITDTVVEEYFRFEVSSDNITWEVVGHYNQTPSLGGTNDVFRAVDGTGEQMRFFRRVSETKAEFDEGKTSGKYGTGILLFKK